MSPGNEAVVGERLHQRGWRKAFTVAEMVDKWAWLVGEVERGYDDSIEEYTNDLYCRNWLHEAWLLLDDHTVLIWTSRIKQLDSRFLAATVHDDGLALDRFHGIPHPDLWWWRRHPRTLTGDLGRSLRSAGATGA
ncbi:hypothetical protein E6W39_17820 [Kitasatospora acidiphila]|uniref:Uncharacterized protein n=1 Tax=Kitasatospora acidiphila TaxID=2567942 RepID=A0A540W3Z4_9ACTN|nr:hypothetical protein [Kitasatospora acidiphila]TQF03750.1 hypothetical protein E6W39_17820 [Kitasatospora acidiphila]